MSPSRSSFLVDVWISELDGQEIAILKCRSANESLFEQLSPAERAVARLAVNGLPTRGIARLRGTSERTVANQLAQIYRKCAVASRSELTALVLAVATRH